jgi:hypothetical protein
VTSSAGRPFELGGLCLWFIRIGTKQKYGEQQRKNKADSAQNPGEDGLLSLLTADVDGKTLGALIHHYIDILLCIEFEQNELCFTVTLGILLDPEILFPLSGGVVNGLVRFVGPGTGRYAVNLNKKLDF